VGQGIAATHFRHYDFRRFARIMAEEMMILHKWFETKQFSSTRGIAGLELETWIIDAHGRPLPINEKLLARTESPDIVTELSQFNLEFNVPPQPLAGTGLRRLCDSLSDTWKQCSQVAAEFDASIVAIGTLPTLTDDMLTLRNMSTQPRYHALNQQILRMRQGRPIHLDISGRDRLQTSHLDVMLEAGTTSLQLHLQVPLSDAVRVMNAATIASAPIVAATANSPYLFGRHLWHETRIPLFEQSVNVGGGPFGRVTLGAGYVTDSLEACFVENVDHYPVMLPLALENACDRLTHLRLHNGTVWRWNRPLVGFDDDETPHLRVEHRVMSAGPTIIDMATNMALYYGLVETLSCQPDPPEQQLEFESARENFYQAARRGLHTEIMWIDQRRWPLKKLFEEQLLPMAHAGLTNLGVNSDDVAPWLGIIEQRVMSGQTGAVWQQRFIDRHPGEFAALVREYRTRQQHNEPVHTWSID